MSDLPPGDAGPPRDPDDEQLLRVDALLDAPGGATGPASGDGHDLVELVGRLRALDDRAWDAAVPLGTLPSSTISPPERSAAAPAAEGRTRRGLGPGRPAMSAGRPARVRVLLVAAAALVLLAAAGTVVAWVGHGSGPHPATTGGELAAWRMAAVLDQPAWADTTATAGVSVDVVCATTADCYADVPGGASTPVIETSTDGGSTWEAAALPSGTRVTSGLACPSAGHCLVAGSSGVVAGPGALAGGSPSVLATADGGRTWTVTPLPSGVGQVVAIACATTEACVAAGTGSAGGGAPGPSVAVVTDDAGSTWRLSALPQPFEPSGTGGVACTPSGPCMLVGTTGFGTSPQGASTGNGVVLRSGDGGGHWHAATIPSGTAVVRSVSCGGTGRCTAVANPPARVAAGAVVTNPYGPSLALSTADAGATWSAPGSIGLVPATLTTISCAGPSSCWAGGSLRTAPASGPSTAVVTATTDGGASWTTERLPTRPTAAQQRQTGLTTLDIQTVTSLSCPAAGACLALGFQGSLADPADQQIVLTQQGG